MKRQSNIRRLCHQALAATLITGSLMGTGLLGNKVVYGNDDIDKINQALNGGRTYSLESVLEHLEDPEILLGLFAIISQNTDLDPKGSSSVFTSFGELIEKFNVRKSGNINLNLGNQKAVVNEIRRRILVLEKEKLQNGILTHELNASREAHKEVSKLLNELGEKFHKATVEKKQAEKDAQQAKAEKEKAEKDAKTAQQESEQAKKAANQAETEKKKAESEANTAKLDSQRAQEEANKLRGEAEKAKQEAEKAKKDLEIQKQKLEQEIKQATEAKTEAEQKL
ncbi:TPA: cell surface protein, partial [Streptococcus equi subsp. zooepidemicus]|nr:cell surface protein [Streptococcus equi subsp. zooepidemicus]